MPTLQFTRIALHNQILKPYKFLAYSLTLNFSTFCRERLENQFSGTVSKRNIRQIKKGTACYICSRPVV